MNSRRGFFIVIEGVDGSGTTTQAEMLRGVLASRGHSVSLTREPTDEAIGCLIRSALEGGLKSQATGEKAALGEHALCLLFAADRAEHSRWIESERDSGVHVISDRFVHSSIAYQSLDAAITPERVIEVNRGCAVPDLTILLRVPIETCLRRLRARGDSPTVYEKKPLLDKIDDNYIATRDLYEKHFGVLVATDGDRSPEKVHRDLISTIEEHLPL